MKEKTIQKADEEVTLLSDVLAKENDVIVKCEWDKVSCYGRLHISTEERQKPDAKERFYDDHMSITLVREVLNTIFAMGFDCTTVYSMAIKNHSIVIEFVVYEDEDEDETTEVIRK